MVYSVSGQFASTLLGRATPPRWVTLGWRNKQKNDEKLAAPVFRAPPGYRDSARPIFVSGEVVNSAYQIRDLLHSDRTGQVFVAWDMLLERVVALKASWRDGDVPPLVREARAPSAIAHQCAAAIYGLGHHREVEYLVAERITGETLKQSISSAYESEQVMPVPRALAILEQLAAGLAAVHGAGFSASRMSTANVVVVDSRRLVFSRFALGQGQLEQKPPVFAPEIIVGARVERGSSAKSIAVDLYALGCVAVELLTGSPPFAATNLKAVRFAHVHHKQPPLMSVRDDVPTELSDMVEELLAKDPAFRPPSPTEVVTQLHMISRRLAALQPTQEVLVVDNDPVRVRRLWSVLRRAHASVEVDAVLNVDDAASKLRTNPPRALIVNLDCAGSMNGFEMCMYLRGLDTTRTYAIIATGQNITGKDVAVLEQVGVEHIVPYGNSASHEIAELIRILLSNSGLE